MSEPGVWGELLAYLRTRKRFWLGPLIAIALLVMLLGVLFFGSRAALETFYQVF